MDLSISELTRIWRTDSVTGGTRWRDTMRALHAYYRRDMRDAREQREELYPDNAHKHVQRTVPLVWSLTREMATSYVEGVARRFILADQYGDPTGTDVAGSVLATIQRIYRAARVDTRMATASEHLVALNTATLHVWPFGRVAGVRILALAPHDQEVICEDIASDDVRDVALWRFVMPVQVSPLSQTYALGEITPTTAVWTEGPDSLRGRGIFVEGGENPLGRVPVVMLRGSDPGPGEWWPPAPEDLLDAQRAVNHDMTDIGHVARLQGFAQAVMKGVAPGRAKSVETGPDTTVAGTGEDFDFKFESPKPDLEGYGSSNRDYREFVIATNGQNPATFMKSPGITALAKQMEVMDRNAARKRHLRELRAGEQKLYDLIRLWVNWQRGTEILPPAIVEVDFREPVVPVDRLHDAQALETECAHGLNSWARERAKRDGVSVEEGAKRVAEDMALNATRAALNGAQVTSMQAILVEAAAGRLPIATARAALLAAFPLDEATVDEMVKPLDGFVPSVSTPAAPEPPAEAAA